MCPFAQGEKMKIVSYNINGIRSSASKGLFEWVNELDADVVCIQEVRANEELAKSLLNIGEQISIFSSNLFLDKYNVILNCGNVAGYAGTMILSKEEPVRVVLGIDGEEDLEGRIITAYFKNFVVVNCYVPNGGSRLDFKMEYIKKLTSYLDELNKHNRVIFCSDFNVAHTELDLSHPKECARRTGFLDFEREALSRLLDKGFCDLVRKFNGQNKVYTWRSYKSRNVETEDFGWKYRFDYILCSNKMSDNFSNVSIPDLVYSDHLPIVATFNV